MEKRECSLCGGKLGRLTKTQLQDGYYCVKCDVKLNKLGLETNKSWYPIQYTVQEVTEVLNDANPTAIVEKMHEEHAKKMSLNNTCLICGKKLKVESGYMTADGRVLCLDCRNAAITISPDEFLVNKDAYIHHHNSDFFIENMKHMEYPSPQLAVNFTLRRFFYRGQLFDSPDCVFPFESVIKFESDACTYQVTEVQKGASDCKSTCGRCSVWRCRCSCRSNDVEKYKA